MHKTKDFGFPGFSGVCSCLNLRADCVGVGGSWHPEEMFFRYYLIYEFFGMFGLVVGELPDFRDFPDRGRFRGGGIFGFG